MQRSGQDETIREKLIGLGEASIRKSYYPELRSRLKELERFKLLLDQANDFIFLVENPGGVISDVNETAAQCLEYAREKLIGMAFEDLFPEGSRPQLSAMMKRAETELGRSEVVVSLLGARGLEIPVEMRLQYLRFGESLYAVIVARDISERIKGEEELHKLRKLLSDIVDFMPSILIGLEPDGRIFQWNQEAERYTCIPSERALGGGLEEFLPSLAAEKHNIQRAMSQKVPVKDDKIPWKSGDRQGFADVTIYPLTGQGGDGVVIRVDDVTERVRLEEMMVQSEKMLTVGGLAAGMAHEINNPLAVILGNAQIIASRLMSDQKRNLEASKECGISLPAMRAYLEKRAILKMLAAISEAGGRAAQIVENMLSFSRLGGNRPAPTDLSQLLDKTVELAASDYDLRKNYDFKEIGILREYDPQTPSVWCDSGKIQQVFLNILKNGAQAMAEKEYGDQAAQFIFRVRPFGDRVRVEIEDNAAGMQESVRKRIFEPFFTTKNVGIGTGLGLSVSYFIIVENHGGTLRVESTPGQGSVFIIELPREGRGGQVRSDNVGQS